MWKTKQRRKVEELQQQLELLEADCRNMDKRILNVRTDLSHMMVGLNLQLSDITERLKLLGGKQK